jgi:site-specific DNA recombinase
MAHAVGCATPRGNAYWNQTTLLRLLQHPVYKGQAPFGRFERRHDESRAQQGFKKGYTLAERPQEQWVCIEAPVLVDEEVWNACQNRFQHNNDVLRGRPERKYLLTGLMRCPQCGRKMRSNRKRLKESAYSFYECRFARPASNPQGETYHKTQHRSEWVDPIVVKAINEVAQRPELTHATVQVYRQAQAKGCSQVDVAQLQRQLADLQRQEQATVKAQVAGIMAGADTQAYESLLRGIATQRTQITDALSRAGAQPKEKTPTRRDDDATLIARALADVNEVLNAPDDDLTPAEKQGLLARVVTAIYPNGKEGLKINLKPSVSAVGAANALNVQYVTT